MSYKDLREYIDLLDQRGRVTRLDGVDLDGEAAEVGRIARNAVLMDNFTGYTPGYRVLVKGMASLNDFFLAANWSTESRGLALTRAWKDHLKEFTPLPPKLVNDGPIMENVFTGEEVDLLKFPVPKWHEKDGGRYIGTHGVQILKDPETGRVNCGTYRMQLYDRAATSLYMSQGKDGFIIREKYFRKGKPCPVVAVFGVDPPLFLASTGRMPHDDGKSELDFSGWLRGMPEEVILGRQTGLPIPAHAEIAIEGEMTANDVLIEGPFGEGSGYSAPMKLPVVRVKALYHRDAPILSGGAPQHLLPGRGELYRFLEFHRGSAPIWDQLEKAGIREIRGVACYFGHRLTVISIRNSYAGHSLQAGLVAQSCHTGAFEGGWVIVVDEDIDPSILNDVLWAVMYRADPRRAIQVLDYLWSGYKALVDPSRPFIKADYPLIPEKATYRSGVVIDACVPVEWDRNWHGMTTISQELQDRVKEKWGRQLITRT